MTHVHVSPRSYPTAILTNEKGSFWRTPVLSAGADPTRTSSSYERMSGPDLEAVSKLPIPRDVTGGVRTAPIATPRIQALVGENALALPDRDGSFHRVLPGFIAFGDDVYVPTPDGKLVQLIPQDT